MLEIYFLPISDNLAYILEGLEMLEASECAKNIIRGQEKVEEISD